MDLATIERLMQMLENSSLNEIEVSEDGVRIRLAKTAGRGAGAPTPVSRNETPEEMAAAEIATLMALPEIAETDQAVIVSGLSGTFYRAPAPGARPYVKEGDLIEEGQTLALVEAMKMLNPVEATRGGRIESILVADGEPVTPGMPLILLASD
ncbi:MULTISPECIES: acetyl-CoA carboxylase biotin carboxyl carrier protein [Alphaproteobacteria]|uniref:Biotin carboxyl carrier protein of acetyl-CoA carboxylase n=2 Tax=Alphaproteobacteria TaxID=28211 RepID=A0A512HDQ3_9HYPH|nr:MULTISPECIES: acetyl-CoA carboxylase biotin carboxyl carrier protein subunit [Alphaproteobacteria]GEO83584.1 acetyl-CoA carboxylase biotin carboxyl carrier protein subunit [Ciceribacter naphthalenivorans]GLR24264.1 acetyl-CoA carboxylase biotin carboxyl carrier protein subunit [Ciceribacter naphthalenivorans]GLT07120.1 acetyl-CoA carboxylase biotin carboxyl carrier protein subunit [Sphingomonas psychrolutea]